MKKCIECKIEKDETLFYKNPSVINGYRPRCKQCENLKRNKGFKQRKCKVCNELFIPKNGNNYYCSFDCLNSLKPHVEKKPKLIKHILSNKICSFCNTEFKPYNSLDKYCSAKCRIENQKSKRSFRWKDESVKNIIGINNPSYRNGNYIRGRKKVSDFERIFIRNGKELKQKMINDIGYIFCENCNTSSSLRFETHHIIFRSEKPLHEHLHDKQNLIVLCISCHNEYHKNKYLRNSIVLARRLDYLFGNDILNK